MLTMIPAAPPAPAPASAWTGDMKKSAGMVLSKVLTASEGKRKRWYDQGKEISDYGYSATHQFMYQSLPPGAFFCAKEALTSEAVRVFGPYLYQQNPHRTVTVRPWTDQFLAGTASILGDYLNYSLSEYDSYANARRCVDQAVVWGRAVAWTGRHPKKPEIICSLYDDVRNFFDDPDADTPEERRIIMRRRDRPREDVIAEYPQAEKAIMDIPRAETEKTTDNSAKMGDSGADIICYYEAYSIVGLHRFKGGKAIENGMKMLGEEADDAPMKYLFTKQGRFVCAETWEVPFYIDGEWPVTALDFYDMPGSLWPVSPLEPGINYQRAINWLSTFMMGRMRKAMRLVFAIANTAGEGLSDAEQDQVLIGNDIEALMISVSGGRTLKDFIQELNPSFEWMQQGLRYLEYLSDRYNKATGKYDILYYGGTETQSRTATDASMKDRNSRSRLEDMKDRIVKWETLKARKDALAARFLLTRQDIGQVMGDNAAQQWGFLVHPDQDGMNQMAQNLMQQGMPPDQIMPMVEHIYSQAVDLRKWAAETNYGIEADSMKRRDIDAQIDGMKELQNQTAPMLLQSPDPRFQALGLSMTAAYQKLIGGDEALVKQLRDLAASVAAQPPAMLPPQGTPK